MVEFASPVELRERAALAKEREIEAHRHAIDLHESSARLFARLDKTTRAAGARRRAQHAREMLALALREYASFATTTNYPPASSGPPSEGLSVRSARAR
jgi:hypothetical protein